MSAAPLIAPPAAPIYQAAWPRSLDPERQPWQETALRICIFALQIIFLPLYIGYCVLQKIAAHALLPSAYTTLTEGPAEQQRRREMANRAIAPINAPGSRSTVKRCAFKTPDGVSLDGLLIRSRNAPAIISHKVVVFCCPNAVCYEQIAGTILTQLRGPDMAPHQAALPNVLPAAKHHASRGRSSHRPRIQTLSTLRQQERQQAVEAVDQLGRALNGLAGALRSAALQTENRDSSSGFQEIPDLSFMQQDFLNPDISVFFFNYRGVGDSKGIGTINTLPLDVYSAYKYLIDREAFPADNIAFYGISMGGIAGPCGAALVQQEYPQAGLGGLSLVAPSSLSAAAKHLIGKKCGGVLGTLSGWAVSLLDVELDAAAVWGSLRGRKAAINNGGDPLIVREGSLTRALGANHGGIMLEHGVGHYIQADSDHGLPQLRQALRLPQQ